MRCWKDFAKSLGLIFRAALRDHHLPVDQVGIVGRLLGEELDPAIQHLGIELRSVRRVLNLLLRLARYLPGGDHVVRRLRGVGLGHLR